MIINDTSEGEKHPNHRANVPTAHRYNNVSNPGRHRDYDYVRSPRSRHSTLRHHHHHHHHYSNSTSSLGSTDSSESWPSSDEQEDHARRTPPPAYSELDPGSSVPVGYDTRNEQPWSASHQRSPAPPHDQAGRRHRTTHAYSTPPPVAPVRREPHPPAPPSSVGAPPPGIKPIGHVAIRETNGSIKGTYILDPDKTTESTGRIQLKTSNGAIDVDLAVLPPSLNDRTGLLSTKPANLFFETSCGGIKLRLHDTPVDVLVKENRANIHRPTLIQAKSSNGNVHLFIPRSFRGILKTTSLNGKMKFSEGIQESMTCINTWGSGRVAFIGSMEGLPPVPSDSMPLEEEEEENGYHDFGEEGINITFGGGSSPAFLRGAGNFTVIGGSFRHFPSDARVFHGPTGMSIHSGPSRRGHGPSNGRQSVSELELQWDGSRVDASSSNGNVHVAYDDEGVFGLSGMWKGDLGSASGSGSGSARVRSNYVITGDWSGWMGTVF